MDDDDEFNVLGYDGDVPQPLVAERYDRMRPISDSPEQQLNELNTRRQPILSPLPSSRRRRLFDDDGENTPIDWHMRVQCAVDDATIKRQKLAKIDDCLQQITERICQARQLRSIDDNDGIDQLKTHQQHSTTTTRLHNFPPTDGSEWTAISTPNTMRRFYIVVKSNIDSAIVRSSVNDSQPKTSAFSLRDEIRQEAYNIIERCTKSGNDDGDSNIIDVDNTIINAELLVDKYAPKLYTDLLSDDNVNRILLTWLKLWDCCVFGRNRSTIDHITNKLSIDGQQLRVDLDEFNRPYHKIVLLCGEPGLGKTTLAYIVARHCGYRIVEMNASDDRTLKQFENHIEAAVRTKRSLDADRRPLCLLMDEIDGAQAPSINYLVAQIKNKDRRAAIKRPIIAICNNLYAPAIRELRTIALILQMPPIASSRLIERISMIANKENLNINRQIIERIAQHDIRSSLNAMQFFAVNRNITVSDVDKLGIVDRQATSLFNVWRSVFEIESNAISRTESERCQKLALMLVQCDSDDDIVDAGLFHNYLSLTINQSFKAHIVIEWFVFVDEIGQNMDFGKHFQFRKYRNILPLALHLLLASKNRVKLAYPTMVQSATQKLQQSKILLDTIVENSVGCTQFGANKRSLLLHMLPYIVMIAQPNLRPVNTQLYNLREQQLLQTVVDMMISFGINYRQLTIDGRFQFAFEPAIDTLTIYPLIDESHQLMRYTASNGTRQVIAHEIEKRKMQQESIVESNVTTPAPMISTVTIEQPPLPNIRQQHQSALTFVSSKPMSKTLPIVSPPIAAIWFKYNEGYSNAIRRNIRMMQLFR